MEKTLKAPSVPVASSKEKDIQVLDLYAVVESEYTDESHGYNHPAEIHGSFNYYCYASI
jgi:hypothetical protein